MNPQDQRPLCKLVLAIVFLPAFAAGAQPAPVSGGEVGPDRLEWRAVDVSGRPIPGAVVWEIPGAVPRLFLGEIFPPPIRRTVSGRDGRFSIPAAVPFRTGFTICPDGYLPRNLPATEGKPPFAVVLRRPAHISGRVLAPDGSPVEGAKVSVRDLQWVPPSDVISLCEGPPPPDQVPQNPCSAPSGGRTDSRGRFVLSLEPSSYGLSAGAAGYHRAYVDDRFTLAEGQEIAGVELRLARGEALHGRITTPEGEPVAGAEVSSNKDDTSAVTDAHGDYRLAGLWQGRQTIRAKLDPKDDFLPRDTSREIVVAAGENHLDLALPPLAEGREVRGRVLAPDGKPARDALLTRESAARPNGSACAGRGPRTAADGSFVVYLPRWVNRLVAAHPGYSAGGIDLPAGGKPVTGAVIRLARACGISVRIQGWEPDGHDWGIRLDPAGEPRNSLNPMLSGAIGPDGRYRFVGLRPGDWVVTANVEDHELTGRVKLAPGAEVHLDLALPPKFAVHGRVVDKDGRPVAGAKVTFHGGEWWESPAISAADGTFVTRVESGTWPVRVNWGGFVPIPGKAVEVAGPAPRPVELAVPRGATLRVRFHDIPEGQVVQRLGVVAESHWLLQAIRAGVSEPDAEEGVDRIPGLPPGDWRIEARIGPAFVPGEYRPYQLEAVRRVTIKSDDREVTVDLVLPRGGLTLFGHVANGGRPLDVILRRLDDPTADFLARPADIDGPFRFSGLPPGRYRLMAADPATDGLITFRERDLELAGDREVVLDSH
jgi:hypothetical protein